MQIQAELAEFDGEDDHVHLLVNYPPKVAVSALVNSLKGVSGRLVRKTMMTSLQRQCSAACYFVATPDDTWRISLMMSAAITNAPPASPRHPSISFSNSHPNNAANTGSIA
ncbi:MAG: REP-associated tyrosine transposase [Burkholderiales bacterium]